MNYNELKSGTDIRGVASDLGGKAVNLTDNAVCDITAAFVLWVAEKTGKKPSELKIAIGHDSRISAERIKAAAISVLLLAGVKVLDCGLSSTPAMFMTTVELGVDASVQITASHHPFDRNGLKFFTRDGGLDSPDITALVNMANEGRRAPIADGSVEKIDFMSSYAAILRRKICEGLGSNEDAEPLKGKKIIVDAGNGAGGFYAENVLKKLGADIEGSQFLEPDGMFPNHIPNPENKEAMDSICAAVKRSGADLGIIYDTDVDRAGCVDKNGNEINRNRLIALASIIALKGNEGGTIVTDSVTSDGLKKFINEDLGGVHYRFKRGYKNVINKAIELNEQGINCPLAIETSGHAALRENYFLDDGAYLATKIVIEVAKGNDIDEMLSNLEMPAEEREIRLNITAPDFGNYGRQVIAALEEFAKNNPDCIIADDNREGMRVTTPFGWMLLRLSVHDPVMPINFESNVSGGVQKTVEFFRAFYENFTELDLSAYK
ncbi:MAG: phosphomannomutase/phosphoglucomutase [Clostridia bacterium]|nr:phosphomannomutase/phosphoglucomutase [Clostridia bacterium]